MKAFTSTKTTWSSNSEITMVKIQNNYDCKLGWFYNEPEWHECVIKLPPYGMNDNLMLFIEWATNRLDGKINDVIWYNSGQHLKMKFKDIEVKCDFERRWSYSWQPEDKSMCHYLAFESQRISDINELVTTYESKIGKRGIDWEICATGVWFRKLSDRTKARLLQCLIMTHVKAKMPSILYRPMSKSLVVTTLKGKKIEMNYRVSLDFLPPNNKTFTSPLGTFFASSLPVLGDYAKEKKKVIEWCNETLSKNSWSIYDRYIYFTTDSDAVIFILRWL